MERREAIEVSPVRRQGLPLNFFSLLLIYCASAFVAGANVSEIVHRNYPAKGDTIIGYVTFALVLGQFAVLTVLYLKARREWKATVVEYDASLEKIRASLIAENPNDIDNVEGFIKEMKGKIPRL